MVEHTDKPLIFDAEINNVKYASAGHSKIVCPFCDTEHLQNIFRTEGNKIWLKNKFSTIRESLMTVIIESDLHLGDVSVYPREENRSVFRFAIECWDELIQSGKYQSVLMFKNFGPHSGGTLRHPHMQIVGLENVDGYLQISPENFDGVEIKKNGVTVTISTRPIMGFVEFNVIISELKNIEKMADDVQTITQYILGEYMGGHCDSYNLFFHHIGELYICKIVPRFITSPYFIGYKIPQVNQLDRLEEIANDLRAKMKRI